MQKEKKKRGALGSILAKFDVNPIEKQVKTFFQTFGFHEYTWVDEQTIQRLFQKNCRDDFGGVSDYLGMTLEVF